MAGNRGSLGTWWTKHWLDLAMVAPLVLYILFFMLVPVVQSIYFSFVHSGTSDVTTENYRDIFDRSLFKDAFINTLGITAIGVSMELVVGMIIALMLARGFKGRGIFRSVVLVPLGVPTLVAGAAMFYFVGLTGYLNEILRDLNIIDVPIYWQQSGLRGMFVIALADLWKTTPLVVLILLAGLEAIPGDVYEAAGIDGANGWQKFWNHTIPLLMPAVTMAVILRAIDAWLDSWNDLLYAIYLFLTEDTLPLLTYYYSTRGNVTDVATVSIILTIPVILLTLFLQRWIRTGYLSGAVTG